MPLRIKLTVVPDVEVPSDSAGIFQGAMPLIRSEGDVNLVCGACGAVLAEHVSVGQIRDVYLRCGACSALNRAD